jgi:NADH-quinone oxidoreductase subunit D
MLLAEANRVTATLAFLTAVLDDSPHAIAADARERLVAAQEQVTGGRVHPMFTRLGGVAAAVDEGGLTAYAEAAGALGSSINEIGDAVLAYAEGLDGLAHLSREDAIGFGTSGAVARASGLDLDLRRDDPYLAYPDVAELLAVPTRNSGDAQARYEVLVEQLPTSLAIMRASIDRLRELGPGPVDVPLPKTVKAPEGTTYGWIEGPLGISGALLASVGDSMPWRLKLRSASFANAQAMSRALVGTPVDRLADAVMSFFFVTGDIDR